MRHDFTPSEQCSAQPPYFVISRCPVTTRLADHSNDCRAVVQMHFADAETGRLFKKIDRSPPGGTDQISTAMRAPVPSFTRTIAGYSSLMVHSR